MGMIKGKIEASITLNPSSCYFMLTGKCSLDIVSDFYLTPSTALAANELLFCPRLYRAMRRRQRMKPIAIIPCECGHAEVVSGHQRACIAGQKRLNLAVAPAGQRQKDKCPVCGDPVTCRDDKGCNRIVTLHICVSEDSLAE